MSYNARISKYNDWYAVGKKLSHTLWWRKVSVFLFYQKVFDAEVVCV